MMELTGAMLKAIAELEEATKIAESVSLEVAETAGKLGVETAGSIGAVEAAESIGKVGVETAGGMGIEYKMYSMSEYESYMRDVKKHTDKARAYETQANSLERKIRSKQIPENRISEAQRTVAKLRRMAENENREAEKCKQAAKRALMSSRNLMENHEVELSADFASDGEQAADSTGSGATNASVSFSGRVTGIEFEEKLNRNSYSYSPGQCAKISTGTQNYCPFAGAGRR